MRFDFATANRILFGCGTIGPGLQSAIEFGERALVVTGRDISRARVVTEFLSSRQIPYSVFTIETEPTIQNISQGVQTARSLMCDNVIAFGGGSVLDAGKAIAAMISNPGEIIDYLEVVGNGKPLKNAPAPVIAIPTTSGTGSEVTRNAVISVPEKGVKVSLRHLLMIPRLAIIDPELTVSVPRETTAYTGMDALTQLIEPFVSCKANAMTDSFCREGIPIAVKFLERAYRDGTDIEAREGMAFASLLSGMALANSGLGAVHGFAAVIGGRFGAPHGAVCAALLPAVVRVNITALQSRQPDSPALIRYKDVAGWLTGDPAAGPEDGSSWLKRISKELEIPGIGAFGVTRDHIDEIVAQSKFSSSMKGNPIGLTEVELAAILEESI